MLTNKLNAQTGARIIGITVIVSSIMSIWLGYIFTMFTFTKFTLLLSRVVDSLAIFPKGLAYCVGVFNWTGVVKETRNLYKLLSALQLTWTMLIILCAGGLLTLNNLARKFFITLNAVHILMFAASAVLLPVLGKERNYPIWLILLVLLPPVLYIIYLTRPRVKEQFNLHK